MLLFTLTARSTAAAQLAAHIQRQALAVQPAGVVVENSFTSIADLLDTVFPFLAFDFVKEHFLRLKWRSVDVVGQVRWAGALGQARWDGFGAFSGW